MREKNIYLIAIMIFASILISCGSKSDYDKRDITKENYVTNALSKEMYEIMFEKEPSEYEVHYRADNYLTVIDGAQDVIYFETFLVYERDEEGNLSKCKSVMVTEKELNQEYMEEYLQQAYGYDFEYTKPYENVYVHMEVIPIS